MYCQRVSTACLDSALESHYCVPLKFGRFINIILPPSIVQYFGHMTKESNAIGPIPVTLAPPQLLLSVVCLSPYVVELGMVLTAARRFCLVCLSEFGRGREETGAEGDGEVKSVDVERKRQRRSRNNDVLKGEDRGREVKRGKKSRLSGVGGAEPDAGRGGNEGVARKVDERVSFVSSLAEMFSALTREPQRFMSEDASVSSSDRKPSLQNILGRQYPKLV